MSDVYALEAKRYILERLTNLIIAAPEGPRVIRRKEEIGLFHHEFAHADLSEKTTFSGIHGETEIGPDKYPFIEFTINTTKYKVRNEKNLLTFLKKRVSKLTLDCFGVKF